MQVAVFLQEISPDAPCGPDLEYDPEFLALGQAAQGKPEQQFGATVVPAVEPNWVDVRGRSEALFSRTKDLRVAVLLVRAMLRTAEFADLGEGLTLVKQLLERYWDTIYPLLDADDNDPTVRLNALVALTDGNGFLRDLRAAHLIAPGAHGRVTVRDILVAAGKLPANTETTLNINQIESIVRAAADERAASIDGARRSLAAINEIQALLNDKLGVEHSLDLRPLAEIVEVVVKACDSALGVAAESAVASAESGVAPVSAATGSAHGEIRSREDAIKMLERVCEFMERTEPSNPAPLLIRRAQRLVSKNFIEIMEDLAPDSLGAIKGIAGI